VNAGRQRENNGNSLHSKMAGCSDVVASTIFRETCGTMSVTGLLERGGRIFFVCLIRAFPFTVSFEAKGLGVEGGNEAIAASRGSAVSLTAEGQQQRANVRATGAVSFC